MRVAQLALVAGAALGLLLLARVGADARMLAVASLPYLLLMLPTLRSDPPRVSVWAVAAGTALVTGVGAAAVAFVAGGDEFAVLVLPFAYLLQLVIAGLSFAVAGLARRPDPLPEPRTCARCGGTFDGLPGADTCPACVAARDRAEAGDAVARLRDGLGRLPKPE